MTRLYRRNAGWVHDQGGSLSAGSVTLASNALAAQAFYDQVASDLLMLPEPDGDGLDGAGAARVGTSSGARRGCAAAGLRP